MSVIKAIEDGIIERLKNGFEEEGIQLQIEAASSNPKSQLTHPKGLIAVYYSGGRLANDTSRQFLKDLTFDVQIWMKGLTARDSVYPILELIAKFLTTYRPPSCMYMQLQEEDYITHAPGEWVYGMKFGTKLVGVSGKING